MKTKQLVSGIFVLTVICFFFSIASGDPGWKKTVTLPSGEVVCDLSGEWNYDFVSRGDTRILIGGGFLDVIAISQQGDSFKGIRMRGADYAPKGQVALEGEVDQNGIKNLLHAANPRSTGSCKAQLSKDGNKIEIQTADFYVELTRK